MTKLTGTNKPCFDDLLVVIAMIGQLSLYLSRLLLLSGLILQLTIQCVSVDSTSFVIYPELEATEVRFSALKRYQCSFYFRIHNETGRIQ